MGKKLFKKTIIAYVVAETESAARNVKIDESGSDVEIELATSSDWGDAIPFGDDEGKTVSEYLEEMEDQA